MAGEPLELQVEVRGEHPNLSRPVMAALLAEAVAALGLAHGVIDVGVELVEEAAIARLNAEYRDLDEPTDVLSFPIDGAEEVPAGVPRQLGDIVICPAYVERQVAEGLHMAADLEAADARRADTDLESALRRCVVHGALHLLGEDHELGDEAAARMFELEQQVLDAAAEVR